MGIMAKTCAVISALAAMNWAALALFQADLVGQRRTPLTDGLGAVVGIAALFLLVTITKKGSWG